MATVDFSKIEPKEIIKVLKGYMNLQGRVLE